MDISTFLKPRSGILYFSCCISLLLLFSCGTLRVSDKLTGTWISQETKITVRSKVNGKFSFIEGQGQFSFTVNEDKSVSGQIGQAKFSNGEIASNWLLPVKMTGVSYNIALDLEGKIFENDPLDIKEVELWLGPVSDSLEAELRYTKGMQQFPMSHIIFKKIKA